MPTNFCSHHSMNKCSSTLGSCLHIAGQAPNWKMVLIHFWDYHKFILKMEKHINMLLQWSQNLQCSCNGIAVKGGITWLKSHDMGWDTGWAKQGY